MLVVPESQNHVNTISSNCGAAATFTSQPFDDNSSSSQLFESQRTVREVTLQSRTATQLTPPGCLTQDALAAASENSMVDELGSQDQHLISKQGTYTFDSSKCPDAGWNPYMGDTYTRQNANGQKVKVRLAVCKLLVDRDLQYPRYTFAGAS